MDISAETSPGHIPVIPCGQTQPAGTDHLCRETSKVWEGPLCQLCQHGSVREKKGQDLAGLSSSVPTLWLCIPASWSPASSLSNSAKAAAGRKSQHGNISSSLKMLLSITLASGTHPHAMPLHLEVVPATQSLVHNPHRGHDTLNSLGV